MQRTIIGALAVGLLFIALILWATGARGASYEMLIGACVRVGSVLGAFWLAWPHLSRVPAWLLQAGFVGALLVAFNRRAALLVIPALIALWFLRPRNSAPSQASQRHEP